MKKKNKNKKENKRKVKKIKKVVKKAKTKKPAKKIKKIKKKIASSAIRRKGGDKVKKLSGAEKKAENLTRIANELIEKGRKRGFITYDEILKTFPDIENNILFLEKYKYNNTKYRKKFKLTVTHPLN